MRTTLLACAAAAGLACQDVVSAPGVCPEFCPEGEIRVLDTLLTTVLASSVSGDASDTGYVLSVDPTGSFTGYLLPHEAAQMQVVGPGGPVESRALIVFVPFSQLYTGSDTSVKDTIIQTDSLQVRLSLVRRNVGVSGVTLALHEIPVTVDSITSYGDMAPYFEDSTLATTFTVPDTLVRDTVVITFPAAALRHLTADSLQVALGVRISSPEPAFVTVGRQTLSTDSNITVAAARLTRFVQVDSSTGTTRVTRSDSWEARFTTYVVDSAAVPASTGLRVGGSGGARAFVKLNLPASILDSTLVVRATLLIPPAQPVFGAPGDTFLLRVGALGSDFGPKSPVANESYSGSVNVGTGGSDTVAVDITNILLLWRGNPQVPRTLVFQVQPEAGSLGALDLPPRGSPAPAAIRVTYAPPFRLPGS